ncbi:HAMP domain-containing histidine kinase [Novosphingobium sp. KCTC 2891]|uniref:sensor histidine kinase n=1 Tax=Novosphingobium sp. KCTC 2891 TaxID=2989730 RepID=UPI002221958A|nr:HAMP domain-containing sensor histidine kinase [Novosphingobium sp. KCTC 2891]MCW1381682.1 HAMP domain-containing histidine kinase [Novosphingobium sp. KCTC 2891]
MSGAAPIRARCDAANRLVQADEPLAGLQVRCGGQIPGPIAIPALLALVRKARRARLPLSRTIVAVDDGQAISAWTSVYPGDETTFLELSQWRHTGAPMLVGDVQPSEDLLRQLAEGHLLLDAAQRVLAANLRAPDLRALGNALGQGLGRPWTDFIRLDRAGEKQPLHWRLLDDATFSVSGSARRWRARFLPQASGGFDLLVIPESIERLPHEPADLVAAPPALNSVLGRDLAPALRQPIARIIANAETIRTRLAGPLADEYANYASDIAEAGRHLMGLVEDLADLEAVEATDFSPAPDHIDLADCARRAAGILSVRAQERGIVIAVPGPEDSAPAIGEFRRVLQVLLNLLTNALRYTPSHSEVQVTVGIEGRIAWISVADEGEGLTDEQAVRVFDKFERLGRTGDGGSGLGLYISRRLARAMGGDLQVAATPGHGACFVLSLPADKADAVSLSG